MNRILPSSAATILLAACSACAAAQNMPNALPGGMQQPRETIVVLGTATPAPLADSSASVLVIPIEPEQLALGTALDALRGDASVFLEQRGAGGAQSDLVLRGGGFQQTLVLLNGFRINDSQTSHHNLDLPIPLDAMDSVQVLHGAGSTLHGVDALDGVVDFLTSAPKNTSLLLRAGGGSIGENEQTVTAEAGRRCFSARLAADRNFSTGFTTDRDYRNGSSSFENWSQSRLGLTDLLFAASDRAFGANQFYGNFPSWERTKSWFASVQQEIGNRTQASYGYRRHSDEFVLLREHPAVYENNHIDASWQASLRHSESLWRQGVILAGLEADGDSIRSNNLGTHARNRGAGFLDVDLHPLKRSWTLSAGLREEISSGGTTAVFSPHLAASWRISNALKLRASGGYGFRVPTYTDLYYSDPTSIGNPRLKPESAWSGDGGVDWEAGRRLMGSATVFYSRQHDAIDYVRANVQSPWQASNLSGLRSAGVESNLAWKPGRGNIVRLSWTALSGAQAALRGLQSEYVFNYPVLNGHAVWIKSFENGIAVANTVHLAKRYHRAAYPVWDASVIRERGMLRPYVRFSNLSNTGYQEINGVAMPGRSVVAGLSLRLQSK